MSSQEPAQGASDLHNIILAGGGHREDGDDMVARALRSVRAHLGLEIAYVSEFVGNDAVFRVVDAPGLEHLIKPGDSRSLDDVYCRHILAGRLPELIPNTANVPLAAALPITAAVPIGAHVSVPLRLPDGRLYGMFCCLSPRADDTLNQRDLNVMQVFADLVAFEIGRDLDLSKARRDMTRRIRAILEGDSLDIVYQPIWSMEHQRPIGFECLSRFTAQPRRPPDQWFAEAAQVGLAVELELLAIRRALAVLPQLPAPLYLAVNASPGTTLDERLALLLGTYPLERIVLELTEHDRIDDFDAVSDALAPLRERGLRLAIDDAGAGYSGLQQILQMKPDLIKLDRFLIQGIGTDTSRRALASALTLFARETGSRMIAEGVETEFELAMLRALGIDNVQGYLLGHPEPIDRAFAIVAEHEPARRRA